MSARTALETISSGIGAVSGFRSRTVRSDSGSVSEQQSSGGKPPQAQQQASGQPQITMLPPAPPPGAAFAVALITGQLPPKPTSERELLMRLGSAELPAQGSLALHDRRV